ncbi:MAG: prefoldin subunit alpha [Methanobacteriaceae archaeon]
MEDQQKLEGIINELNVYKSQSEMLQQQVDGVQASLNELEILETTLKEIEEKKNLSTLVPVGAGSFINAEIKNTEEVIMSIGSGVAVTKKLSEAQKTVGEQREELTESLNKLLDNLQKIGQIVASLSPQAEQLMAKLQGAGQAPM